MSHIIPSGTIARTLLLAGILLAVTLLAARTFFPAFAQTVPNAPPTTGQEKIDYDENDDNPVVVYTATDPEMETVHWSIVPSDSTELGANSPDAEDFEINNGVLTFEDSPDFENPTDRAGTGDNLVTDNTYVVQVRSSDVDGAGGNTHTITVTVNVKNVNEDGTVKLSHPQPKEDFELTATLTDPDGAPNAPLPITATDLTNVAVASTTWQWSKSMSTSGPWSDIANATTTAYTPVEADVGHYLRATVTYHDGETDGEGTKETASEISDNMVVMKEYVNTAPMFLDPATTTPVVVSAFTIQVPEDESLEEGAAVGDPVTARDLGPDGTQQNLTYSVLDTSPFTIHSSTGQLRLGTGTSLDYEDTANRSREVVVTATDPDLLPGMVTVTIEVTNVDENPEITSGDAAIDYDENTETTTPVQTFTATDDETPVSELEWTLSGAQSAEFSIAPEIGASTVLSFNTSPNYESPARNVRNNEYKVRLTVTDGHDDTTFKDVTVKVTNVDEDGTVTLSHVQPRVGIRISAVLSDLDGSISRTSWQWERGGTAIDGATSSSYTPVAADDGTALTAVASYTDGHGASKSEESDPGTVASEILNADRVNPVFTPSNPTLEIREDLAVGGNVGTVTATDANPGESMIYSLTSGDRNTFEIDRASGQITTKAALNFEARSRHSVRVTATDSTLRSTHANVTINVTNFDEAPVIAEGGVAVNYPEIKNSNPNTDAVFTYRATDDETNNSDLQWIVSDTTNFEINSTGASGVLRFTSARDFEALANPAIPVTVTVTDGNSQTATRDVTVTVTNVDEPGVVSLTRSQPKVEVEIGASLRDPDGSSTASAPLSSADLNITGDDVTWQWARGSSRSGSFSDITGATSTTYTPVDADGGQYLRATATYTDGFGEDRSANGVTDHAVEAKEYINAPPMFLDPATTTPVEVTAFTMEVKEDDDAPLGTPVGDPVTAKDLDQNERQEALRYEFDGTANQEDLFDIDSRTGQIKLGSATGGTETKLDYENPITGTAVTNEYIVVVKAVDPSMASSTVTVTIKVMDVEESPEFSDANADNDDTTNDNLTTVKFAENTATTTMVSSYNATDDEDGATPVKWSLDGADMDQFSLCNDDTAGCPDPALATVQLRFKEAPNFESPTDSGANNVYNVTVIATDDKDMKTSRDVTVMVTDMDEPATVILSSRAPEVGIRITARLDNPDGRTGGINWQWYRCGDSTCGSPVIISGATSQTYTPFAVDVGDDDDYLRATATYTDAAMGVDDPGGAVTADVDESKSDTASVVSTLAVQPKDDDNTAPVLPDVAQREIAENSPTGTAVGAAVTATDDEDGEVGGPFLTYTMRGTDAGSFDIASSTGQITVGKGTELDYEGKRTYRVIVTATDPSDESDSVSVTINVTNMNEPPTVSQRGVTITGPARVSYAEDRTDTVDTYRAVGPDASGARWALSGPDASAFSIPNGELIFSSPPDFENAADANTDNMYSVTIMVRSGDFEDDLDVTVTVINVDEPGAVTITPTARPRVGTELTAALTDEDGTTSGESWQWARSTTDSGPWTSISNGTSATYTPVEGDADNYLQVTVSYTDEEGPGKSASATTTATVLGVAATPDDGTVSVLPVQPVVGTAVTARLSDPDGTPTGTVSWQWAWSTGSSAGGTWTDISGATSASYTPVAGDVGRYLRATATYEDSVDGVGQTASSITANAVQAATQAIHEYDRDANGRIEISEAIEAVQDYFAGRTTIQVAIQVVQLYFSTVTGD